MSDYLRTREPYPEQPSRFRRCADSVEIKARTAAWMAFDGYQSSGLTPFEAFLGALDVLDAERKRGQK